MSDIALLFLAAAAAAPFLAVLAIWDSQHRGQVMADQVIEKLPAVLAEVRADDPLTITFTEDEAKALYDAAGASAFPSGSPGDRAQDKLWEAIKMAGHKS